MTEPGFQKETFLFLKALAANNSKDWFDANKSDYQRHVKKPADAFRPAMNNALQTLTGHEMTSKQFRINRDLRFSKNKTPYNTHIRMAFWPVGASFEGRDAQPPSFFLSIEADTIRFGTGCMAFSKPVLGAYLTLLEKGAGESISMLLALARSDGFDVSEPDLVNPPRGFPKDHAYSDLARHKGIALWKDLPDTGCLQGDSAVTALAHAWKPTLSFWQYFADLQERT
ncbi:hypothetical protein FIV00_11300 [Labrenzia sp. THAF82]|uniref:TIGR02453 family protein n=1 Tax=Labrenzia sp. THAF82 TaxID=2587861 RepID=UPI0012689361|nr:TIGR02453 family protein [Labrenzia sp. THAF82]QFT31065.1 hypothetical protein FIV00_11300 [Labrenzia sp. THAF82]